MNGRAWQARVTAGIAMAPFGLRGRPKSPGATCAERHPTRPAPDSRLGIVKYVLMIGFDASAPPQVLQDQQEAGCGGWSEEMEARGVVRGGAGLRPSSEATTVRVRQGRVLRSDGPFAETKDQIGGFVIIECADLDEAIEIAAKHPSARFGQIEIRPVWEP